jgi:hypothetical protein
MTAGDRKGAFVGRPGDANRWIKSSDRPRGESANSARLTIDVTPAMRRRLKLAAVQRGETVADMLRALLAREFPDPAGDQT